MFYDFRKKAQLKKKRGVPQINEQMLFHGTSSEFVEAICIHNFDWRINGVHGAVFGKGNNASLCPGSVRGESSHSGESWLLYDSELAVMKLEVTRLSILDKPQCF